MPRQLLFDDPALRLECLDDGCDQYLIQQMPHQGGICSITFPGGEAVAKALIVVVIDKLNHRNYPGYRSDVVNILEQALKAFDPVPVPDEKVEGK